LPAGLSVNTGTGLISGTPTAAGTSSVTLSATNVGGTGTATLTLTINPAVPAITSATTATGTVGSAFSYQITATNSPTSYGATGLPAGLSVNTGTGLISGTPTAAGTSSVTLSATNAAGTGTATLTLTIAAISVHFVQSFAQASPGAAASLALSFPANTGAGDFILVAFDYASSATPSSVADSQGNVFTPVGNQLTSPGGDSSRVYYAKNIKGGADTVTVTLSRTSVWLEIYLIEYSGTDPNNPIDAQAGASGGAGAVSSGNATTTVAGDVIYGYCAADAACTVGSGFTARSTLNGNLLEDMVAGSAGSYAATGTANSGWTMQMVALKPASGGGGGTGAPVITSATTASGTVGSAFTYQITATNTPTSYGATGLPAGLSVNTGTGLISGTPTAAGTSSVTLSATNAAGTGTATLTLTIAAISVHFVQSFAQASPGAAASLALSFPANTGAGDFILVAFDYASSATPSSVADSQGNVFTPVGNQLTSPGGDSSRVYYAKNIKGGADTVTVTLSRTSVWLEIYLIEYSGTDPNNPIDAQAGASGGAGAVSSGNATTTVAGDVIYGYCAADAACTVGSGFTARSTLNGNLLEDMVAGSAGSYAATGTANSGWTMQMVALKPASGGGGGTGAPVITSATTASGTVGSAFTYQITATNTPTSYGATGLPAGLSVNTGTGLISGTPTAAGTSTVTLSATNAAGTGTADLTLTIAAARVPVITSANSAGGEVGVAFSYQITATNTPKSYGATGLPMGLSVNTGTGLISGTPTAAGTSSVTLSATNAGGTGSATLTLTIVATQCSNTDLGNGIQCVASSSISDTSGSYFTSVSAPTALDVQPGDSLVVAVRYESSMFTDINGQVSVQTSAGDILNYASGVSGPGNGWATQIFYVCGAIANPASTVTVYFSTAQAYPSVIALQYRGLATNGGPASCLDVTATGTVAGGSAATSGSFTTTQPNEVSLAVGAVNATGVTFSAGTGYTMVTADPGGMAAAEQQAFTSTQSGVTASMGLGADYNGAIVVASFIAGPTNAGAGLPAGHGAFVWAATNGTSNDCGGAPCVLVVTDSKGNTYTTLQTNDEPSANVTNFLAFGQINTALAGDGSDYVTCSFYMDDGVTPIVGGVNYCRVLDMSNVAASGFIDSSAQANGAGTTVSSGALTVTSGNTDLIFSIFDLYATGLTITPGNGYTGVLNSPDGGGGTQYGEYKEVTAGETPTINLTPGTTSNGAGAAIKESNSGGTVTSVNGAVHIELNSSEITVQIPPSYGSAP
jgi:hypothetical protein